MRRFWIRVLRLVGLGVLIGLVLVAILWAVHVPPECLRCSDPW